MKFKKLKSLVKYVEMASQIVSELFKVTASVRLASAQASESLRSGDDADAFATISNMIEVVRNFFKTSSPVSNLISKRQLLMNIQPLQKNIHKFWLK